MGAREKLVHKLGRDPSAQELADYKADKAAKKAAALKEAADKEKAADELAEKAKAAAAKPPPNLAPATTKKASKSAGKQPAASSSGAGPSSEASTSAAPAAKRQRKAKAPPAAPAVPPQLEEMAQKFEEWANGPAQMAIMLRMAASNGTADQVDVPKMLAFLQSSTKLCVQSIEEAQKLLMK